MHTICDDCNSCLNAVQKWLSKEIFESFYLCEAFNFFDSFFTLNLVLHKTNIRLFQFDLHSEFKSLDHLLVEILILIMIITYFILY